MEKRIKIVEVKNIETKDGKKFTAFKALDKNGKRIDCKFTRTVLNVPTQRCFIYVDDDAFNVDERKEFPVLWVKRINKIENIESENATNKYFD